MEAIELTTQQVVELRTVGCSVHTDWTGKIKLGDVLHVKEDIMEVGCGSMGDYHEALIGYRADKAMTPGKARTFPVKVPKEEFDRIRQRLRDHQELEWTLAKDMPLWACRMTVAVEAVKENCGNNELALVVKEEFH